MTAQRKSAEKGALGRAPLALGAQGAKRKHVRPGLGPANLERDLLSFGHSFSGLWRREVCFCRRVGFPSAIRDPHRVVSRLFDETQSSSNLTDPSLLV